MKFFRIILTVLGALLGFVWSVFKFLLDAADGDVSRDKTSSEKYTEDYNDPGNAFGLFSEDDK